MKKILFVCTGNICRSPLAEGILRDKLDRHHIPALVDSCGFESFHIGDAPDHRAQQVAEKRSIDISSHRARLFKVEDFDLFDAIYVMDASHYSKVMSLCRDDADRLKVDYLMNMVEPGMNHPVQDPWYHDIKAFEKVYIQMAAACDRIVKNLMNEGGS